MALQQFYKEGDWQGIKQARSVYRENSLRYAEKIKAISQKIEYLADEHVRELINRQVILPLGLDIPQ